MKYITEIDFQNKTALVRVDFNVTLADGKIQDATKIVLSLATINKILDDGGRVIIMSHLGRPAGIVREDFSLKPVFEYLNQIFLDKIAFANLEENPENYRNFDIVLLENLRFHLGEEKCDLDFAKILAKWGTVYVNDAFATIHRKHASLIALPKLIDEKCVGLLMQKELDNANKLFDLPKKPLILIIGGAKVSDKIAPIQALLKVADKIILGGVVANTFMKVLGHSIGQSKFDKDSIEEVTDLIYACENNRVELVFPKDFVCIDTTLESPWPELIDFDEISENFSILDIGPNTQDEYGEIIEEAGTVLWSGPMGYIECEAFAKGTESILYAISEATKLKAFVLMGGGETLTAISKLTDSSIDYGTVSTGGSALLQYIANRDQLSLRQLKYSI